MPSLVTILVNTASGGTLIALALQSLSRERAGRLLALYLGLTGAHFFGMGLARLLGAPVEGAIIRAAHIPIYFALVPISLFASAFTGIHAEFWAKRRNLIAALALPTILTLLELALPEPIVIVTPDRVLLGEYFGWWMVDLMVLTAAFWYATILLAFRLARETDPARIASTALLLAGFTYQAARIVREGLTSSFRWTFLPSPPPLVPDILSIQIGVAVLLSLIPLAIVLRAGSLRAREAGTAAIALAALVSALITLAGEAPTPVGNARWILFALLVAYGALRHGMLGVRRVGLQSFELPLAAAAFATFAFLTLVALQDYLADTFAVVASLGIALVATALVAGVSGASKRSTQPARRYSPERELGRGSQGRVVLALDTLLHRSVVLKRVAGDRDGLREARAAARVSHPSLVAVHDVAEEPEGPVLVMEYVQGGTLEERLRSAPLTPSAAARLATELCDGLSALHAEGLTHGDIKASNVFFRANGRAALGDFGSAHVHEERTLATLGRAPASASLAGVAPETLGGSRPDGRADVYGMGALPYRALTNESYLVFPPTFEDARHTILTADPRIPHARIPEPWAEILARALAKDPAKRYQSAKAMRDAVARIS